MIKINNIYQNNKIQKNICVTWLNSRHTYEKRLHNSAQKTKKFKEEKKRIKIRFVAKIKCTLTYFNGQKKSCEKKQKAEKKLFSSFWSFKQNEPAFDFGNMIELHYNIE